MAARIKTWVSADDLLFSDLNAEFDNIISELNSIGGASIADGSITEAKFTDAASPATYFGEIFEENLVIGTGLDDGGSTGLNQTITAGTAYVIQDSTSPTKLIRVTKTGSTVLVMSPSTTNFIDLSSAGVFTVTTSSTVTADSHRLASVVTDSSSVTGYTDVSDRIFLEDFKIARRYREGVELHVKSNTKVDIKSGTHVRDSTNSNSYTYDSDVTLDISGSVGDLGLDQGSESSSEWYAVVGIFDSTGANDPSGVLVDKDDYPSNIVIPSGFDQHARLGWVRNNGSSNFIQGRFQDYWFIHDDARNILTTGSSGTFSSVDASAILPPGTRMFEIFAEPVGSNSFFWRITGSGATSGIQFFSSNANANSPMFACNSAQSFDYKVDGGSVTIDINMYKDTLEKDS